MKTKTVKPVLILQTGSASAALRRRCGDYDRAFVYMGGLEQAEKRGLVCCVHVERGQKPDRPQAYSAVLITGSDAYVTDRAPWSEAAAGWLRGAMDVGLPVFGVCYGHQLLAYALGGIVADHPAGIELGTRDIELVAHAGGEPLLVGLPRRFAANLFHSQTVAELPKGAEVLASSDHDPHQILYYGPMALSTQFHPEIDGEVMAELIDIQKESGNPVAWGAEAADAPYARTLFRRFVSSIPGLL